LQQQALFLDELFQGSFDDVVAFSAPQPIAGITLRLDGDQLAALPVITGEGLPSDGIGNEIQDCGRDGGPQPEV
jgi:hypothetical protein